MYIALANNNNVALVNGNCYKVGVRYSVWPDVGMKSSPNFPIVTKKLASAWKLTFFNCPKRKKYLGYFG